MDKKKIIIISVSAVLAIALITVIVWYFGVYQKRSQENNVVEEGNVVDEEKIDYTMSDGTPYKVIDKEGLYYQNGIKVSYKVFNKNGYQNTIRYPIISGLKNTEVQDKINQSLRKSVENILQEAKESKERTTEDALHFYISCEGNFANVISFYTYIIEKKADSAPKIAEKYLSYNLVDGNELKLSDVIQPESKIPEIILAKVENKELKKDDIIKAYKTGKISVGVSPRKIFIVDSMNSYSLTLNIYDYTDNVVIYDRFNSSENLFDGTYDSIGPIYNLSQGISISHRDIRKSENFYIDYTEHIFGWEALNNEMLSENVRRALNKQLDFNENRIRSLAAENPSNFYFAVISTSIQASEDGRAPYDVVVNMVYVETTKIAFNNTYFPYSMEKIKNPENEEVGELYGMNIKRDGSGTMKTETKNLVINEDGSVFEPSYVHEAVQTNTVNGNVINTVIN